MGGVFVVGLVGGVVYKKRSSEAVSEPEVPELDEVVEES